MEPSHHCSPCSRNMISAYKNPQPVEEYLALELAAGRIIGIIDLQTMPETQVSCFGVIPKTNQPGKWWLILDLSSPKDLSVNDEIPKELCSMQYASIDDTVDMISQAGQACLLAKIDVEHTYRNVPVHSDDRPQSLRCIKAWDSHFLRHFVLCLMSDISKIIYLCDIKPKLELCLH